jgi:Ca-activated chloride channel family protein
MPGWPDLVGSRAGRRRLFEAAVPYLLCLGVGLAVALAMLWAFRGDGGLRFARPGALALLGGVPLAAWALLHLERRRSGTFTFSRGDQLLRSPKGPLDRLVTLPHAFRVVAIALVALALGRPQTVSADKDVEIEGIDIVLALDLSNSMEETDLLPNRLDAAKQVIDDFIRRRKNDRIGLVVFGREAYTQCPLTLDYSALRSMLGGVRLGLIDGHATAIGNALGVSLNRLRRSDAQSKVLILLTDGDNNAGNISPLQAARFAQSLGVRVFTVLVGQNDDSAPTTDRFGNPVRLPRRRYPVNPKLLEQIAAMTGGTPYLATDRVALERRFHQILEELDKSTLRDRGTVYAEAFPRFLWPAFALVLLEGLLSLTRLRRFP